MPELPSDLSGLDLAALRDKWRRFKRTRPVEIVEPGPGQESVWDYPRPPRVEPVTRELRVEHGGRVLGESRRGLRVIETSSPPVYYLPPADVELALLCASETRTFCEWKGVARYWSLCGGELAVPDLAWSYPAPDPGFESLRDYLAFSAARVDACFVDHVRVRPQPGEYYGGWITPELTGPFKGEPGSESW